MPDPSGRVIAYVDGFNLYHGMKQAGARQSLWLDVAALAQTMLRGTQTLEEVRYYTARVTGRRSDDDPAVGRRRERKKGRQQTYLSALKTLPAVWIGEGKFILKPIDCRSCGERWQRPEEKMTDVNIATDLLVGAFEDRFDTAILVTGDSDLVPPVRAVLKRWPHKRILIAFPPKRDSFDLRNAASGPFQIRKRALREAQLPDPVVGPGGREFRRPDEWGPDGGS